MSTISRRTVLALLSAGIAHAQLEAATAAVLAWRQAGTAYVPVFFTAAEHDLLDVLTEMILPETPRSPGARAAKVADFVDLVVAHSTPETQQAWRRELQALDAEAQRMAGGPFAALPAAARTRVLDDLSARERQPDSDAVRAFVRVKQATIDGYYSSEIGLRRELGYLGPQMLAEFKGCDG
jgi:hypothetical protein